MSRGQRINASTGRRRPGGVGAREDAILTSRANDTLWGHAAEDSWRILLVDHDEADYALVRDVVAQSRHIRFHLDWARTGDEALRTLAQQPYDVCLLTHSLGERTGIDLLAELETTHPQLPVIMLTSQDNHDEDLAAMRAGAMDYLVKTRLDADRLERTIRYVLTQRRTEEALWESEARNRALLIAIPDMIFTFGEDGTYLDFMPAPGVEPYGKPEDFLGKTVHEVLPADKAEHTMQDIRRAFETGAVQRHEYTLASGQEQRDFEYRMVPSGDDEVLAIVRDITVRKRVEEALLLSQERFALAVWGSNDGMWDWPDITEDDEWWSPRWYELLGYEEGEVEASYSNFIAFVHPDDRERIQEGLQAHFEDRVPYDVEYRLRMKSGDYRWFRGRGQALWDDEGHPVRMSGSIRDITERKQAEETLRLQSEIVQNMAEGVYLIRVSDGCIVFANPTFEQMFGYDEGELIGRHVSIVNAPTDKDPAETANEIMASLLETGVWNGEVHNIRKDGTPFWCQANVTTVDHTRYGTVWVSVHIDITARKQAEAALRESEQKYRHYAERLQSLRDMDQAILAVKPPKEVAHMAVEHLLKMIPCRQASAILFDFEADTVDRVSASPASPVVEEDHYALRIAAPLLDDEVHLYQATRSHFDSDEDLGPADGKLHCILDVLLKAQTQTLGTLSLKTDATATFTDEEVDIVREIAKPLAIAFQNAALFDRLETGRERLQALSRRLVEVQEAERRHLAQELHDEVGQLLTGLLFVLRASARLSESPVREHLKEAETLTQQVLGQVRELSLDLRPAMLNKLGLVPTLLWHFDRYTKQTNIEVDFRHFGCVQRLDAQVETTAYRVVQEALTNVARHARTVQVIVRLMADQERLLVEIEDQGEGFDLKQVMVAKASTGLSSMLERVGLLSGVLRIETSPEQGTHILAELPLTIPTMHEDKGAS